MTLDEAIRSAISSIRQFFGDTPQDIRLEEITVPEHSTGGYWEITVGFLMPLKNPSPFNALRSLSPETERVYKKLFFDSETGEFIKMENRLTA